MSNQAIWELPSHLDVVLTHVEVQGKRVVDVGSGDGTLVRSLIARGADAVGVECGEAMLAKAAAADPDHPERYMQGVGQDLPIDDSTMDLVVFSASLHHVPVPEMAAALAEADRVLIDGGVLCVIEPVAAGPGFETHRLIDDETQVRAAAQAALDDDLPAALTADLDLRFETSYCYSDLDHLRDRIVSIDPARASAFDSNRAEIARRLNHYGTPHDGAIWLTQPHHLRTFRSTCRSRS